MRLSIRLAATLGIVALASAARATPATTAGEIPLRSGPGPGFGLVATIPGGDRVDVNGCHENWCIVDWRGRQGYVFRQGLTGTVDVGPPLAPAARPEDFRAGDADG